MIILDKGSRALLTAKKLEFLEKAIKLSWRVYDKVRVDTAFVYGNPKKISSSLILAELLEKSNFGEHPLAQEKDPGSNKPANNLTLMPFDRKNKSCWKGKHITYKGKDYKSFSDWDEFCLTFSDQISFHEYGDKFLFENLLTMGYNSLIDYYDLEDFEIGFQG